MGYDSINIDSKISVSYFFNNSSLRLYFYTNIEELGEKLSVRFSKFCIEYGSELQLIFEPGKFLVSQAGHFITQVNVVKQTTSTVFAQVDSRFNHLIRPMHYGS